MKKRFFLLIDSINEMYIEDIKYDKDSETISVGYTDNEFEALTIKDYNVATLTCSTLNERGICGITTVAINL